MDDTDFAGRLLSIEHRLWKVEQCLTEMIAEMHGAGGLATRLARLEKENGAALVTACELEERLSKLEAKSGKMEEEP